MARKALSEANKTALLVQINADIEEAAQSATKSLMDGGDGISYPPNGGLTSQEREALASLRDIPYIDAALRKIIADAASFPAYRFLEYIDGVADPNDERWSGVSLTDAREGRAGTSYHDDLYAWYWEWRRTRPDPGWRLDNLETG